MLVKVAKPFRDRYTRRKVFSGNVLDVTEQRMAEINAAEGGPYVAPVEAMDEEPPVEEPPAQKRGKKQEKNQPDPLQEPSIADY